MIVRNTAMHLLAMLSGSSVLMDKEMRSVTVNARSWKVGMMTMAVVDLEMETISSKWDHFVEQEALVSS
jgi:hypothetical protein